MLFNTLVYLILTEISATQTSIQRINAEMQLSVIAKCPLFEKTRILPSVDA